MQEIEFTSGLTWLALNVDEQEDFSRYQIDSEVLGYAEDKNERPHTEFIEERQELVLIFNTVNLGENENQYRTTPITFIAQKNRLITLYRSKNAYFIEQIKSFLAKNELTSIYQLLFTGLFLILESYFPIIEKMDKSKDEVNKKLREKTTKKSLLALSDLETGMLYLVSAANQNSLLLEKLKTKYFSQHFTENEKEQLEDAVIEAQQLSSMTQLNAQVLEQLVSAYNNILNNNLNDNITTLTIISVLLASLAVVTGFFGMNIPLPFTHQKDAWVWIIVLGVIFWFIYAAILRFIINRKS